MTTTQRSNMITYLIAASSSLFFCSKGVFVKSAYAQGVDTITVLALRMSMALPFFLVAVWLTSLKSDRLPGATWAKLAVLGFVGYYLSSVVNFHGLRYVSVGLERVVLFTYPSMVLLIGIVFRKRTLSRMMLIALMLAYGGIVIAFAGEAYGKGSTGETALGIGLVFTSAVTYAVFVSVSGTLVHEVGALRFTSIVVGFSCLCVMTHYVLVHDLNDLAELPALVYFHGGMLAMFGTVIPSFLMGVGLKRAGAETFAIIGTIGPVGTIVLAWLVLGETLNIGQLAGFVLSLTGGLAIALMKSNHR